MFRSNITLCFGCKLLTQIAGSKILFVLEFPQCNDSRGETILANEGKYSNYTSHSTRLQKQQINQSAKAQFIVNSVFPRI
jgi:hypothetical protein